MSERTSPLEQTLGIRLPGEGGQIEINNHSFFMKEGILRQTELMRPVQEDISSFYDVHWKLPGGYDNPESDQFQTDLFRVMFPGFEQRVPTQVRPGTAVLDVGCGSGVAGRAYFAGLFDKILYTGADMSAAIEQAQADFRQLAIPVGLVQAEINSLPFRDESFDFVFCPGVLHYTNDMGEAIGSLARTLKKGGHFVSWIYREQKPIRKLTDAYIRSIISVMTPQEAFEAVKPLTKLGIALGKIKEELDIPEDIPYLGVKAGKYNLQRFFYYHIMKLFDNPELPFTRHVINNWNAYYPKQVQFLPSETIKSIFLTLGFKIEVWNDQGNGIAVDAVK